MSANHTQLIPRATIDGIVAHRGHALECFDKAYSALVGANTAIQEAHAAAGKAAPNHINSYTFSSHNEREGFLCRLEIAKPDDFRDRARRLVDIAVWSYIVEMTSLETVMDKEAKDALRAELNENPPEVTAENVSATLERFIRESDLIWRRGLANAFSKLDRRFRSHDGWKIGSRIIIDRVFDEFGHWSYYSNHQDTLHDVERIFFILDGRKPPPYYYGIRQAIDQNRGGFGKPHQTELLTEFFKVRIYKNGNCHSVVPTGRLGRESQQDSGGILWRGSVR